MLTRLLAGMRDGAAAGLLGVFGWNGQILCKAQFLPPILNHQPAPPTPHAPLQPKKDALGGNSLTLLIATLRQGDWEASLTTLRHAAAARGVRNYPVLNHGRARALLHKLRFRLLAVTVRTGGPEAPIVAMCRCDHWLFANPLPPCLPSHLTSHAAPHPPRPPKKHQQEDRETLREQLSAAPAAGDPAEYALSAARLRDLEARLLEEREEKAGLAAEGRALKARLAKLKDAGTDELREKAELQEALIRSEEQRLEVARALIDFQSEANARAQDAEAARFALERRVLELEAGRMERFVRAEDAAALADARDELNRRLRGAQDDLERANKRGAALEEQLAAATKEVRHLNQLIGSLEAASAGDASALMRGDDDDGEEDGEGAGGGSGGGGGDGAGAGPSGSQQQRQQRSGGAGASAGAAGKARVDLRQVRLEMQRRLKQQERRIQELEAAAADAAQQLEATRALRTVSQDALDQARAALRRRMEGAARQVADMARRADVAGVELPRSGAGGGPSGALRVTGEELFGRVTAFIDEAVAVRMDGVG